MPTEVWRPVIGYEGLYEVSNLGKVRSFDRMCPGPAGTSERHNGRLLKSSKRIRGGCLEVQLMREGIRKHRTVHSLVAEAFLGPRPVGDDVMHTDGNRQNNCLENLRYGTRKENLNQTYDYGGKQGPGKLTKADALDIMRRLRKGEHPIDLAKEYGVNSAAVYHIRNGTTFKWLREEESYA